MSHLSRIVKSILKEGKEVPSNWRDGFKDPKDPNTIDTPLRLMSGEEPFQINGKWFVYVWDEREEDIVVYDFSTDLTIPYMDFQQQIGMLKENKKVSLEGLFSILTK
jgi:hypothetical protein